MRNLGDVGTFTMRLGCGTVHGTSRYGVKSDD